MNARDNIKPKTIRLAILMALADGGIATIDDLQSRMDEPRAKIASNVHPTMAEGLIKRLRDDVTSLPAYQITTKGREYLASFAGGKAEAAEQAVITPGVKVEIPAHACPAPTTDDLVVGTAFPSDIAVKEAVIANLQKRWDAALAVTADLRANRDSNARMFQAACADLGLINEHLGLDPNDGGADPIIGAIEAIQENLALAESMLSRIGLMLRNSSAEAVASEGPIETILANILHKAAHQHEPVGYVIQRPAKPLVRFSKVEKAQARALCFARSGQRTQVFALIPAGVAVPGAEWRPA